MPSALRSVSVEVLERGQRAAQYRIRTQTRAARSSLPGPEPAC